MRRVRVFCGHESRRLYRRTKGRSRLDNHGPRSRFHCNLQSVRHHSGWARRTFDVMVTAGRASVPGMKTIVFSRTLRQEDHPEVAIVMDGQREAVAALKAGPGKDIWLFGGGSLFGSLAEDGLVDTVEVAIVPILLGAGVPLLPRLKNRIKLSLTAHRVHRSGRVSLEYSIT
jgi:dihydrofolate reductase